MVKKTTACAESTPGGKLKCKLQQGHSVPCEDPHTGTQWRHPKIPYGVRKTWKRPGHKAPRYLR